ncbi:MAG TPA: hypothetical protein VGH74_09120 [Planctomycetaceae bacterium]|jgi:hypothetical protein
MPNWLPTVALIAGVLVTCQIFLGTALTAGLSAVSRRIDAAAFWGSILNQCVAMTVAAVLFAGLSTVDWAKLAKASGPRRGG